MSRVRLIATLSESLQELWNADDRWIHLKLESTEKIEPGHRLGAVDVHRVWMIVAAIEMKALKLWSVLQERMAIPLFSFNLPK